MRIILPVATAAAVLVAIAGVSLVGARDNERPAHPAMEQKALQKVTVKVGDRTLRATLFDNPTARDFAATLPFEADMHDLLGQEKAGRTVRALSTGGAAQRSFTAGDIGYWSPSADLAIYYRDGDQLPSPGIIMIGKVEGDIAALKVPGNVRIRFARAD